MSPYLWFATGAGFVIGIEALYWLYWRYLGAGSIKDYINDEEEPEGNYQVIRKFKTPTQRIALVKQNDDMLIYSNGEFMFGTVEGEDMYAEVLVHIPMAAAKKRKKVLIIGGGGGLTTREALRYDDVEKITTVDIDEEMMNFGKNLKELVQYNQGSLNHPKVETVTEDGRTFVENNESKWDVIMIDVPEPTDKCPSLSRLYSIEFYRLLKERLEPEGVMSVGCAASSWMPEYFGSIQATLKKAGFHVLPYHNYSLEDGEDWAYCLATTYSVKAEDIKMQVPTRFLTPARLKDMFHMPLYFTDIEEEGEIQTDHNRVLLDIVEKAY